MPKIRSLQAEQYQLGEIIELKAGYPWRGAIQAVADGSVKAVQPKDISDLGELLLNDLTLTELTGKRDPDWLRAGDVVLINKGLRNTVAYIEQDFKNVTYAPTLYLLRPKSRWKTKLNMKFIAWQLSQAPAQTHFKRSAEGSLQVSLRRQVVEDTPIAVPALEIQTILAKLYDDSLQEHKLLNQLIENRKQQMTAIAKQLLNR